MEGFTGLLIISSPLLVACLSILGVCTWLHVRHRRQTNRWVARHAAAVERAATRFRITLPREEILRRGRRAILGTTLRLTLLFAFFVAIPFLINAIDPMPRGTMTWVGALSGAPFAIPAGFAITALRQLQGWPLDRSFAFVSPSAGLVLLGPTQWFHRGAIHPYSGMRFVKIPNGVKGVGKLEPETGMHPPLTHEFDWPPSVGSKARVAITALLIRA